MRAMKKKLLIRAAVGFLFGIAMMLVVPVLINGGPIARVVYSDALLARTGSPAAATLLTLLVMGLFGSFCFVGTLFYEIERWPLALATAAHYLSMSLVITTLVYHYGSNAREQDDLAIASDIDDFANL